MHQRKRVRFSDEEQQVGVAGVESSCAFESSSRQTLLPEPDVEQWQPSSNEEEGPIKSTDPGFAAAVRALHRKRIDSLKVGEHLELSLPNGLKADEEDDAEELRFTEDGIPIEPFNLKAEQSAGYFDADGNYLAYRDQDDTDAWLETLPDGPMNTLTLQIAQTDDNVEHRPQMTLEEKHLHRNSSGRVTSDLEICRQRIVRKLQRGETVLDALRRLGSSNASAPDFGESRMSRFTSMRLRLAGTIPTENRQSFDALTEDAGQLLNAGDAEIYLLKRETLAKQLENSLMLNEESNCHASTAQQSPHSPQSQSIPWPGQPASMSLDSNPSNAQTGGLSSENSRSLGTTSNLHSRSTGLSASHAPSKAKIHPESMADFEYDETSGLYYNSNLGCYFDTQKQLYGDASSGQWFSFEEGQYKLVSI